MVDSNAVVFHTPVIAVRSRSGCGGGGKAIEIFALSVRPRAHLKALFANGGAITLGGSHRLVVLVAPDESLVSVRSSREKVLVVDDTCPYGREGKEDADDCEDMGDNLIKDVCKLESCKDSCNCVSHISVIRLAYQNVPGMNIV